MQQSSFRSGPLRFGAFEADLHTGELTKRGKQVRLQEQPFRLLAVLLEKPGELVTREELRGRLWPQTIVDFDHGLNKAISKIRDALGDSAENPRFVETVAGRGYRFLADVTVIHDARPEIVGTETVAHGDPGPLHSFELGTLAVRSPRAHAWRLYAFGLALFLALAIALSWSSANGGAHHPRFAPWRSCLWRTFRATRRRNISPMA
jgi:DNA-binding winged helix-turn-helix (wHTH) protein